MSNMRAVLSVATLLLSAVPSAGADVNPERVGEARKAAGKVAELLKSQLISAIAAGGPASAIGVCSTVAPELAKQVSSEQGLTVKRTALRVRNPANAPDDFERAALSDFAAKISAGADPAKLERSEIVRENGAEVLRFMKAIPMAAEPCLACHGSELKPDVKEAIARLYPRDQATGFKPGELRGAFSIIDSRPAR